MLEIPSNNLSISQKIPRCFEILRICYKKAREHLLEYKTMYWCTRMVGDKLSGYPTDVYIIISSLRMIATSRSGDQIEDLSNISEETRRKYFKTFCTNIGDL